MLLLNLIVLCIGLVICFAGLKIRRICNAVIGFFIGAIAGIIFIFISAFVFGKQENSSAFLIILFIAVISAVLSVVLERIITAIHTFFLSFILLFLFIPFAPKTDDEFCIVLLIVFVAAIVIAYIVYYYHKYSYVIMTAFLGAFLASLAAVGLFSGVSCLEVLFQMFMYGGSIPALLGTILLGIAGCYVQIKTNSDIFVGSGNSGKGGAGFGTGQNGSSVHVDAALDRLKNIKVPIKENSGKKELDWGSVWSVLKRDKYLFVVPLCAYVIEPIIEKTAAYAGPGVIFWNVIMYIHWILIAVSVGIVVYLVIRRRKESIIVIQIIFILGFLVQNNIYIGYMHPVVLFFNLAYLLIVTGILLLEERYIPDNAIKNTILTASAVIVYYWIIDWIQYSFYLHFGNYEAIGVIFVFATVYYLLWINAGDDRYLKIVALAAIILSVVISIYQFIQNRANYEPVTEPQYEGWSYEGDADDEYDDNTYDVDNIYSEYNNLDDDSGVNSSDMKSTMSAYDYESNLYKAVDVDAESYLYIKQVTDDTHVEIVLTDSPYNRDFATEIEFSCEFNDGKFISQTGHKNDLLIDSFIINDEEAYIVDDEYIGFFEAKSPDVESFGRYFMIVEPISENFNSDSTEISGSVYDACSAYADEMYRLMREFSDAENFRFTLAHIDGDEIPELLISSGKNDREGVDVYTYIDGSAVYVNYLGFNGSLSYVPWENLIGSFEEEGGHYTNYIMRIEDDTTTEVNSFGCCTNPDDEYYWIDYEDVSQEYYEEYVNAYMTEFDWRTIYYEYCFEMDSENIEDMCSHPDWYLAGDD